MTHVEEDNGTRTAAFDPRGITHAWQVQYTGPTAYVGGLLCPLCLLSGIPVVGGHGACQHRHENKQKRKALQEAQVPVSYW
jgi:hypothetical protein